MFSVSVYIFFLFHFFSNMDENIAHLKKLIDPSHKIIILKTKTRQNQTKSNQTNQYDHHCFRTASDYSDHDPFQ